MASHPASSQGQRNRARIAQVAARLIAEHGLTDWAAARRKACRELGFGERERLPANEEIEQALRDYNSLYQPQAQAASLRAQRLAALDWMERLAQWQPLLVGGVAAGWATEHSDVRVELEAEDPKSVELALINAGIEYTARVAAGRGLRRARACTPDAARPRCGSTSCRRSSAATVRAATTDERLSLAEPQVAGSRAAGAPGLARALITPSATLRPASA